MESNQQNHLFEDMAVTEEARSNFKDIAQWAGINAVTAFIALGISFISTITSFSKVSTGAASGGLFGFLISAAISLLLNITLLQASQNLKKAFEFTDQGYFGLGLTKFASYFKILGILLIIALVIMILAFLIIVLAGGGRY